MTYGTGDYRYELVDEWAKMPEGWFFIDAGGLAIDAQDRVYVLNRGAHPVIIFDREGNVLNSWGEGAFTSAHGTCLGPDSSIYCTDDANHTVRKFTLDGKVLMTLGTKDHPSDTGYTREGGTLSVQRGGPPFNRPTSIALSASGEIYVSDGYGNARIHTFSPKGKLLSSWGEPGSAPGQFRIPHVVRVDQKGRLWVCDRENSRIQIFSAQGEFIDQWTDIGGKPNDLFFGAEGTVFACIKSGERPHGVSIFTLDGKLVTRWGSNEAKDTLFWSPHSIVVDSRGDIYVGEIRHGMRPFDRGARAVQKFARVR